jgi:hypothetical protein
MTPPPSASRFVAASDCECARAGWIAQPVNTASSLLYVGAALDLLRAARAAGPHVRPTARATAAALAAVGIASVAYHGPGGRAGRRAHDAAIVALHTLLALHDWRLAAHRPPPRSGTAATIAALAVVASTPRATRAAQALAAGAALAGAWAAGRQGAAGPAAPERRLRGVAAAAGALGAAVHAAGRTGGPACRPHSWLQAHALWHALSAVALAATARAQLHGFAPLGDDHRAQRDDANQGG